MNIQDLARRAIERISSMPLEELEKKFIEAGYLSATHLVSRKTTSRKNKHQKILTKYKK